MAEDEESNEIVAAARNAKRSKQAANATTPEPADRLNWPLTTIGIGIGIGSAALAAALLYANRNRDKH
ncbi:MULTISPECIES: hypothetical protein [unclassified Sphingomonas]|jgi:hypothetical protein|uniref:hypothetical protein n=1 Tax=unclassified Sphingomonas TaxID=196159 RepID=UPI00082F1C55|nr:MULTISPECIES: hypothetical protein [unclassified Sphingomonas]MCH4894207.1 hypothetical protein [Sphingomonas sp. SFZ2018-12]